MVIDRTRNSDDALPRRLNSRDDCRTNSRRGHLPCIDAHKIVVNRPCINESFTVHHRDTICDSLVHVGHVGDVVHGVVVVDVCDLNYRHARVRDIDVFNVPRTRAVPRDVNFSRRKRKPSDRRRPNADADSANKCD